MTQHGLLDVDVAVVGGGPAGATAAMTLGRLGLRTCIIESGGSHRAGERLDARFSHLLREVGLADPETEGHRPSTGIGLVDQDMRQLALSRSPDAGAAWHLDREAFDSGLVRRATRTCAWIAGRYAGSDAFRSPFILRVQTLRGILRVRASSVVDATGRRASFARRHGGQRCCRGNVWPFIGATADLSIMPIWSWSRLPMAGVTL